MGTGLMPVPACELTRDENAVLIHIAVRQINNAQYPYELLIYPKRSSESMVFHHSGPGAESPEKPREVRWIAHGLPAGHKIVLESKTPNTQWFVSESFEIVAPCNTIRSEVPQRGPGPALQGSWFYNVFLKDAAGNDAAKVLDPEVIIKDD
jgi:hypothetical protein